jgi:hypothetical protein
MILSDILTYIGVTLILLAFLLLSIKKIEQTDKSYLYMNFIGAGFACVGAWLIHSIPFVLLEGIWSLVALWGIVKKV